MVANSVRSVQASREINHATDSAAVRTSNSSGGLSRMSQSRRCRVTRRQALAGTAATTVAAATSVYHPAIAQTEPIRVGYLPALTGPSSSTGIGINRGTELAIKEINASGGINGR